MMIRFVLNGCTNDITSTKYSWEYVMAGHSFEHHHIVVEKIEKLLRNKFPSLISKVIKLHNKGEPYHSFDFGEKSDEAAFLLYYFNQNEEL
jgi:hypothetical protein